MEDKGDSNVEIVSSLSEMRSALQTTEEFEELRCPLSDEFLLRFLHAAKLNTDRALSMIWKYYKMRRDNQSLFDNLTPECLSISLMHKLQIVLKTRDTKGRQIFIFRAGSWNPSEVNMDAVFQCNVLCLEEMTSTRATQINGVVAIVDFDGFSYSHVRHFTPKHAIRMVQILQGSFPCRFKEFHLLNQPYVFNILFAVVKPLLSTKMQNRIFIHGSDPSSLLQHFDASILPDFLGGEYSSWKEDWRHFYTVLLSKNEMYKDMCQHGFQKKVVGNKEG